MFRLTLVAALLVAAHGRGLPSIKTSSNGRILGGEDATIEEAPYQAILIYENQFVCGGTILSETVIASSARCIYGGASGYKVRVGTNVRWSTESTAGQFSDVASIVIHERYNELNYNYDVSVLHLITPIVFGSTAAAVELPYDDQFIIDFAPAVVTGFGDIDTDGGVSQVLQTMTIPIFSFTDCSRLYLEAYNWQLTQNMICAGVLNGKYDVCNGDLGGPLVVGGVFFGISSWGPGCGTPKLPGIWARVPTFVRWLTTQMS